MREPRGLGLFDGFVMLAAISLGLVAGWFTGSYASLAIGWLISMLAGPGDWVWSLAVLGGIVGAAGGVSIGFRTSSRALRSAPSTTDAP
jgi:hypothetical protein